MKLSEKYPTHVYWDERDKGYIALAPDLPGCSAFGKTREEALGEIEDAIEDWIETASDTGLPIPQPSPVPKPNNFSGKVLLRLAPSLHERLAKDAQSEGVSLNQWMVSLLSAGAAVFHRPSTVVPSVFARATIAAQTFLSADPHVTATLFVPDPFVNAANLARNQWWAVASTAGGQKGKVIALSEEVEGLAPWQM